ncbi:hypothetical protein D3C87_2007010 [compost metagenome]
MWRGGKIVIKIKTKLRLIAPLMQTSNLLAQHKRVVRVQRTGREIIHHQKAVVAIAAKRPDLRNPDGFAAGEQFQLVGFRSEDR